MLSKSRKWVGGFVRRLWPFARTAQPAPLARVDAAAIVRRARRLRFRVRPEALSTLAGAYHGARPGVGLTFAELRAYEPGDDVRHLDWNVTARQGKPYVRRFTEERALTLWLIVDVSASLRFGPDGRSKADRAAQAAALLATAAAHNGDRVGLVLVSDRVEAELPPGAGPRHLARLIRALVATPTASRGALGWWAEHADVIVVEGVGGLLCPLAEGSTVADLAVALDYPLVIVARRGLGTLNHALLTVEAARLRGLRIAGIILNGSEPATNAAAEATNAVELAGRVAGVAVLADVPHGDSDRAGE